MSLLADLLSKVAPGKTESGIPPALQRSILNSRRKALSRRRVAVAGLAAVVLIFGGIAFVRYVDRTIGPPAPSGSRSATTESVDSNRTQVDAKQAESFPQTEVVPNPAPDGLEGEKSFRQRPQSLGALPPKGAPHKEDILVARATAPQSTNPETGEKQIETERAARGVTGPQKAERDEFLYAARNFEATKDYDQALRYYKKALELDRQNYLVMSNVASILIMKASFKEAAGYARAALTVNKDHVPSLVNLGISSIQLGNVEDGNSSLLKALSLEPTNRYALLNLALLCERQNNYDDAKRMYLKLSELRDVQGQLGLARVAERSGKFEDAKQAYREALVMDGIDSGDKKLASERLTVLENR